MKKERKQRRLDSQHYHGDSHSDSDSDHEFSEPFAKTASSLSYKFYDNSKFTIGAQPAGQGSNQPDQLKFEVEVPFNSYLSMGFGATMKDTDMIIWQAQDSSASASDHTYTDLWSTRFGRPGTDNQQDVTCTSAPNDSNTAIKYSCQRAFNTGDAEDFIVPYDQDLTFSWAYRENVNVFTKHQKYGFFSMRFNANGTVAEGAARPQGQTNQEYWFEHGLWMAGAWAVLGYIMFAAKRYGGKFGMLGMYIHALCGYAILIITLVEGIRSIQKMGEIHLMPHTIMGTSMTALIAITSFSGSAIMILGKDFCKIKRWETHKTESSHNLKKFHIYLGTFMLILSVFTVSSGIYVYQKKFADKKRTWLGQVNLLGTWTAVIAIELIFRAWRRKSTRELKDVKTNKSMTVEEFQTAAFDEKKHMVILDNYVLDMGDYHEIHPGGKFVFQKNYGRDVSKYFYGAYMLVNSPMEQLWNHSATSIAIASAFVTASLKDQEYVKPVETTISACKYINSLTTMFSLKAGKAQLNWKQWYSDFKRIGQHFLVYSKNDIKVKRQYTICSAIEPNLYDSLCSSLDSMISGENATKLNEQFISQQDSDFINLTAKDYKTERGVASQLHRSKQASENAPDGSKEVYFVKGPMGMGLDLDPNGLNVVFAGGTGILVALDAVAMLAIKLCNSTDEVSPLGQDFKLYMWYTSQNDEQAIGVQLMEKLQALDKKLGGDSFRLVTRIGSSKGSDSIKAAVVMPRWDENYIKTELTPMAGQIKKVVVCGAPAMNQTFDIAFEKLGEELKIPEKNINIL